MKKSVILIIILFCSLLNAGNVLSAPDTWTQKTDLGGSGRYSSAGFSIGSKGYIGTGYTFDSVGHNIKLKDFWEYDPASDTWTQKADLGGAARGEAKGISIGGKG